MKKKELTYEEKYAIAKEANKAIQEAIKAVQSHIEVDIQTDWDGDICVDGTMFFGREFE